MHRTVPTMFPGLMLVAAVAPLLGGCGGPSEATPSRPLPPEATWKTIAPDDPTLLRHKAKSAYIAAMQVLDRIDAAPRKGLSDYPKEWRIKDVLGEPLLTRHMKEAAGLAEDGLGYRNAGLDVNPRTVTEQFAARPRSLVLSACPKAGEFFFTKSGNKAVGTLPEGYAKPPYQTRLTLTQGDDGKWRLTDLVADGRRTCTPSA